jgi:rSAM/selenodomain-associated transferase 1
VTAVVVLAKEPRPGRVKTRLCPPLTSAGAAALAAAALDDTLDVAEAVDWSARFLALDSDSDGWDRPGWQRFQQCLGGLDRRIGHAIETAHRATGGAPVVLIGMDTPHVRVRDLCAARDALTRYDAVLGSAEDGGYWLLGLQRADARLIKGVPMSSDDTAAVQLGRLRSAGLSVALARVYRDIDTVDDARAAIRGRQHFRFARTLAREGVA